MNQKERQDHPQRTLLTQVILIYVHVVLERSLFQLQHCGIHYQTEYGTVIILEFLRNFLRHIFLAYFLN